MTLAFAYWAPNLFKEYEDKFGDAESIEVSLTEIPYYALNLPRKASTIISEDGKQVVINYQTSQSYNQKGKVTNTPSQQTVFTEFKNLMDSAVREYSRKFPPTKKFE